MIKTYIATNGSDTIKGTALELATKLKVSKQSIYKAYTRDSSCVGYKIFLWGNKKPFKRKTKAELIRDSIDIIKRARMIIDENNEKLSTNNEYSNVSIIREIDSYLSNFKEKDS